MGKTRFIDLTGQKFNRLTVISFFGMVKRRTRWNVICDCGTTRVVDGSKLKNGHTKSCGCLQVENRGKSSITHGKSHTLTWHTWVRIRQRCNNVTNINYNDYGGRGIKVCDRWMESYENFLEDMGERPIGKYSLDRIDNSKGYSKENCRWATDIEQSRNTRRNVKIMFEGEMRCMSEIEEMLGFNKNIIGARLRTGNTDNLFREVRKKHKNKNTKTEQIFETATEAALSVGYSPESVIRGLRLYGKYKQFVLI